MLSVLSFLSTTVQLIKSRVAMAIHAKKNSFEAGSILLAKHPIETALQLHLEHATAGVLEWVRKRTS